jgi:hypothetical protein
VAPKGVFEPEKIHRAPIQVHEAEKVDVVHERDEGLLGLAGARRFKKKSTRRTKRSKDKLSVVLESEVYIVTVETAHFVRPVLHPLVNNKAIMPYYSYSKS